MITTIALDLDNTLLNADKEISNENERVLKQLHRDGKRIVLCTGRPIQGIQKLLKQLALFESGDYAITFNGGLVQHNQSQAILDQTTLNKANVAALYADAQVRNYPLDVIGPDRVYSLVALGKSDYEDFMGAALHFSDITFDELPDDQNFGKVVCSAPADKIKEVRAGLPANLTDMLHIVPSRSELLEFLPKNVNKARGLSQLVAHFDESLENVMAFGDEENDYEMIDQVGIGVAMGNAIPKIKQVAKAETLTNNEDGVAAYLKQYFNLD